jgi:multiple sugar transport system substrate-binding protein
MFNLLDQGKFRVFLSLLVMILTIVFSSCTGGEVHNGNESQKQAIRVAVREGAEAEGIRGLVAEWQKRSGHPATVQTLGRENYEADVTNDLLSSSPKYDVVFFPGTLVAEMAERGALAPIDKWNAANDPDLLAYSSYNGKVYGLPCDVSTFFMFYRDDVVSKPPETWDDLLKAIPQYSQKNNSKVPTNFGLAFAGKAGEEPPKIFYPMMWSYGGTIIENDQVGIDSPGAIAAAEMLKKFVTSGAMPPDLQTWEVTKILDELQRGSVAVSVPQWNALYPLIQKGDSSFKNSIKIAQLPGVRQPDGQVNRVNFRQTWVLVKSNNGQQKSLADDFILFATGKEGAMMYAKAASGTPARASVLSDPEMQKIRPEFPLLLDSLKIAKAEPEVPYYAQLHRVMNEALSSMIAGTATPEKAMREAADKVRALQGRKASAAGAK